MNKRTYSVAFLLVTGMLIIAVLGGCKSTQTVPETDPDFKIEITTWNTSWRPAMSLSIDANGSARHMYIPPGVQRQEKPIVKRFQITERQVRKIQKKIAKINFFELQAEYEDKRFPNGWNCEVIVTSQGQSHTVHINQSEVRPIISLLETVNEVTKPLPQHMKFLFYVVF